MGKGKEKELWCNYHKKYVMSPDKCYCRSSKDCPWWMKKCNEKKEISAKEKRGGSSMNVADEKAITDLCSDKLTIGALRSAWKEHRRNHRERPMFILVPRCMEDSMRGVKRFNGMEIIYDDQLAVIK